MSSHTKVTHKARQDKCAATVMLSCTGGGFVQMDNSTEEYRLPCTDNPCARDMTMETQYGGLGQWDCMIMVTRMQHNAVTKLPLTVAVDVQCETVTVNFRVVLCLSLF